MKLEFLDRLADAGSDRAGGDELRAPQVGAAAGRRRGAAGRAGPAARRALPGAGAERARPGPGAGAPGSRTSRSSPAPPRRSPTATSTARWTSSSRCSSRSWRVPWPQGLDVRGYVSMCFGDPWEGAGRARPRSSAVGERLLDLGCSQLSLGDTIGVATPGQVEALLEGFDCGRSRLAVHFHDTYGQALANTLAALRRGVTTVDSSAGGLGGCPYAESATGNLATEDLVWMLDGLGIETGVDLDKLVETSAWMAERLGRPEPVTGGARADEVGQPRAVNMPVSDRTVDQLLAAVRRPLDLHQAEVRALLRQRALTTSARERQHVAREHRRPPGQVAPAGEPCDVESASTASTYCASTARPCTSRRRTNHRKSSSSRPPRRGGTAAGRTSSRSPACRPGRR